MSEPARHHYTPQFYLSAWCSEGKGGEGERLCVVQNFNRQIRFTRRAPKAIGFQDHLYSFSDSLPTPEPAALETQLFSPLDNKGKVLITKLIAGERLDPEERRLWATFLAAMRARTPENIALVKELGTRHVKWELTKGQGEYEALKTEGDPETIVEWVESRYPGLIDNFGLSTFPRVLAGEVILKIEKMTWHPLNFSDGRHRLLSSDRPCVFTAGIDDSNCIIALPLSPRHAFVAFYHDSQAQAALRRHGPTVIAAALNQNVVGQAKERAYCYSNGDAPEGFYRKHLISQAAPRQQATSDG